MNKWTRRSLLLGGALVALPVLGSGAGKLLCRIGSIRQTSLSSLSFLTGLYSDSAATRELGKKYVENTGASAFASLKQIEKLSRIKRAIETGCPIQLRTAVMQACRDDFRSGRTHCIDGWVLAQTELDIAALYTLDTNA
jgi:hypothetical protein